MAASWQRPLVVTHARPDGDAIGSLLAVRSILRALGLQPIAVLLDPVPHTHQFLVGGDPVPVLGRDLKLEALTPTDGVIVVDTCAYEQLLPLAEWFRASKRPILVVDHHVTRDLPAETYLIDTSASAAALIIFEWAKAADWPLDRAALQAIFVGMATDTGWFRFSNTDARTLERAAELLERGVNASELYNHIYNSERPGKIKLLGVALATLELLDDNRIAVMRLGPSDFRRCGADPGDTEGIINEPMRIAAVEVSVSLVEQPDGFVRVSLRSRAKIDVASVAATFNGGGHPRAAGARIKGSISDIKKQVLAAIRAELQTGRQGDKETRI